MEYYLPIYVLPEKPPTVTPPMQAILMDTNARAQLSTTQWNAIIAEQDQYVVTEVSHYKEQALLPNWQHEYVVLRIQLHPDQPAAEAPILVRVSRTIQGTSCLARLGVYGKAHNTASILGRHADNVTQLSQLTWADCDRAPSLTDISKLINSVHDSMPEYCLFRMSCYSFAHAVIHAIYLSYNGAQQQGNPDFLTRQSHLLWIIDIPVCLTRARTIAKSVAVDHINSRMVGGASSLGNSVYLFVADL